MNLQKRFNDLAKAFPLHGRLVRRCILPSGKRGEPYCMCFEPGGGLFGEYWDTFDEHGIIFKGVYNAVTIAQYALYCYERICAGDEQMLEPFLRHARKLAEMQDRSGAFVYDFPDPSYGLSAGWTSAMAQGEACSVFLRAHWITGKSDFLDHARAAIALLERDVRSGGVSYIRGRDVFFEEAGISETHILNGHLSAAFGVWEASTHGVGWPSLTTLHAAAIDTLQRWLPLFDDRGWSYYQLAERGGERHYANLHYHQTHINQLRVYAAMTGIAEFDAMSDRWLAGLRSARVRARVWADSAAWLTGALARRITRKPAAPWRSPIAYSQTTLSTNQDHIRDAWS